MISEWEFKGRKNVQHVFVYIKDTQYSWSNKKVNHFALRIRNCFKQLWIDI